VFVNGAFKRLLTTFIFHKGGKIIDWTSPGNKLEKNRGMRIFTLGCTISCQMAEVELKFRAVLVTFRQKTAAHCNN